MKKFLSVLTAAICITACAFSFTACGDNNNDETHTTHNWSTTYTEDGDRHYQTCDGCDEKKYSNHDYGTSGVCVCGKQKPDTTVAVTGITLNKNTLTLEIGGTETLTASVAPENATDKSVTWESNKPEIASVDNTGKVTAIKDGTATITVKTANDKTATCTVTVNAAVVAVESVTLNKSEITLEIDETETLTASVAPDNATDKTVTYTVEPTGIVTVDNTGKVTAVAAGTATITATANGKTAECSVTVNAPLTNAQVLKYLNDNVLKNATKHFADNYTLLSAFSEDNVSNVNWYISKDSNNITGANLVFNYSETNKRYHIALYNVEFAAPLTPQNVKDGTIVAPSYTKIYSNAYDFTIQDEHTALTNAICNKLFGENTTATRYIIDDGSNDLDQQLGNAKYYSVIEITENRIIEKQISISYANNDTALIENLNDNTKYYTGTEKISSITGDKLNDNNEPF